MLENIINFGFKFSNDEYVGFFKYFRELDGIIINIINNDSDSIEKLG